MRFKLMLYSMYAFAPASTSANPPVESKACFTVSLPSPLKPELVSLTKVVLSAGREHPFYGGDCVIRAPLAEYPFIFRRWLLSWQALPHTLNQPSYPC